MSKWKYNYEVYPSERATNVSRNRVFINLIFANIVGFSLIFGLFTGISLSSIVVPVIFALLWWLYYKNTKKRIQKYMEEDGFPTNFDNIDVHDYINSMWDGKPTYYSNLAYKCLYCNYISGADEFQYKHCPKCGSPNIKKFELK